MSRRNARELVLKSLFQMDFSSDTDALTAFGAAKESAVSEEKDSYALTILWGIINQRLAIDKKIKTYTIDWKLERMPAVDRNILRIAVFEMFFATDKLVSSVAINEAVELAKLYGTDDSARFVNGVLGKMVRTDDES
ncbi:MAG TPA: transcription antitermination factor NusB [Candidatus Avacidaminococcus intestinavium]|uniref:Transcription antitermination protein NusB n=1 Tax=Candidatus Avacidaminococcus intestinavium TaxID=2840684 RepID=A0A9D1SL22_9FIRM|nr:transcription antitermination factor NusB [Candidatus Avacidaminococcus intestinavium]